MQQDDGGLREPDSDTDTEKQGRAQSMSGPPVLPHDMVQKFLHIGKQECFEHESFSLKDRLFLPSPVLEVCRFYFFTVGRAKLKLVRSLGVFKTVTTIFVNHFAPQMVLQKRLRKTVPWAVQII